MNKRHLDEFGRLYLQDRDAWATYGLLLYHLILNGGGVSVREIESEIKLIAGTELGKFVAGAFMHQVQSNSPLVQQHLLHYYHYWE